MVEGRKEQGRERLCCVWSNGTLKRPSHTSKAPVERVQVGYSKRNLTLSVSSQVRKVVCTLESDMVFGVAKTKPSRVVPDGFDEDEALRQQLCLLPTTILYILSASLFFLS